MIFEFVLQGGFNSSIIFPVFAKNEQYSFWFYVSIQFVET